MVATTTTVRPLLVFDGDCAFCTSSVLWLGRRFPATFDLTPYQRADLAGYGLTVEQCHDRLQWLAHPDRGREPAGRQEGARAVVALLRAGGRSRGGAVAGMATALGTLAFVPPTSWVAAGVYRLVAANRSRLPGGTPACRL
ncbi:MAG TPA: DCC1-like thiol-disulfide oxidoreductase family protein [Candidatus Nanopelagicales bacterium]|jgi:predicted DCC family thiol-disulfide oxidoreductase YuxK